MRTWPRDSGRSWQTDSVKPEYGWTWPPAMSAESVATWNWMSGVAASALPSARRSARMKQPPWLMPMASGPRAKEQPLQADAGLAEPGVELVVGGDRPGAFVAQPHLQVVLQVLADAGQRVHHRRCRGAAAARRARCRRAAAAAAIAARRRRAAPRRGSARCVSRRPVASARRRRAALRGSSPVAWRLGLDAQVGAAAGRREVGLGGAAAPALVGRQLEVAGALLARAVEVVGARHADLAGAGDEGLDQLVPRADVGDLQRARRRRAAESRRAGCPRSG